MSVFLYINPLYFLLLLSLKFLSLWKLDVRAETAKQIKEDIAVKLHSAEKSENVFENTMYKTTMQHPAFESRPGFV